MSTILHVLTQGLAGLADPLPLDALRTEPVWWDTVGDLSPYDEQADAVPRSSTAGLASRFLSQALSSAGEEAARFVLPCGDAPVYLCGDATSSLDVAYALAREDRLPEWGAVLALSQRAGRGQLRRPWSSPRGNIYAALRLPCELPFMASFAALSIGCLLAEGFAGLRIGVQLKWPNDLLLDDCKVGGILLEERGGILLAGIGINCVSAPPPSDLRQGWAVRAVSLQEKGYDLRPLALFTSLVNIGRFWYRNQILRAGAESFPACAERHLAWVDREIVVHGGDVGDDRPGRIAGLSPEGGLRIRTSGRERVIHSGSLVPGP